MIFSWRVRFAKNKLHISKQYDHVPHGPLQEWDKKKTSTKTRMMWGKEEKDEGDKVEEKGRGVGRGKR